MNNGRISDRILDADTMSEIQQIIAEGSFYGMQTFDQSLLRLVQMGIVTIDARWTRRRSRTTSA